MAKNITDVVAFITEPSIIEISGGVVRVRDRSGDLRVDRAMSAKTLAATVKRAQTALEQFARGEEHIVVDA